MQHGTLNGRRWYAPGRERRGCTSKALRSRFTQQTGVTNVTHVPKRQVEHSDMIVHSYEAKSRSYLLLCGVGCTPQLSSWLPSSALSYSTKYAILGATSPGTALLLPAA